jgi:voltage-gated potassium channel Kch
MDLQKFSARLRYEFDKTMAKGPIALIGWLALISLAIIIVAAALLAVTRAAQDGGEPLSFGEGFWQSLMRTLDSGTMGGDTGWGFRTIMLLVTLAGIFIVSALIGVLSTGLEGKLDQLRKGRSLVLEQDHTIIYNWSPSIFDIISELTIANASRKKPRIVILANMDKVEMEDEIASKLPSTGNTRIICRSGDPNDLQDIRIANPQTSRSIIILSPTDDEPDSQVIKTIVALVNDPQRRKEPYQIAAEIRESHNIEVARIVGGAETQLILADELIARIVVHSSRQSGLSTVYTELLDFDGSEIYTADVPFLAGTYFGHAVMGFEASTLIGICDSAGNVHINPPMNRKFEAGDQGIFIAEDDSAIKPAATPPNVQANAVRKATPKALNPERTLILGWNRRGPIIANELSRYVAPGSHLTIAANSEKLASDTNSLVIEGHNLTVELIVTDTTHRSSLEGLNIPGYDHVLVLGYSDDLAAQIADTRTLVTLLHLRQIADKANCHISVVSEMIDVRNRELAEVTRTDDFVVSNKLVSLMLAQASENRNIAAIFDSLLDAEGSELYMRDAAEYVELGTPVTFHTVTHAARLRSEVAIGHALKGEGRGGVVVNPVRSNMLAYKPGDRIIVLAQD